MCLKVSANYHKRMSRNAGLLLDRDLVVWKGLEYRYNAVDGSEIFTAPYRTYEYKLGELNSAELGKTCSKFYGHDEWQIHRGLHSFKTIKKLRVYFTGIITYSTLRTMEQRTIASGDVVAFPAIIPKGSRVFFGTRGDIVSTKLIVYRDLKQLQRKHGKLADPIKVEELF